MYINGIVYGQFMSFRYRLKNVCLNERKLQILYCSIVVLIELLATLLDLCIEKQKNCDFFTEIEYNGDLG